MRPERPSLLRRSVARLVGERPVTFAAGSASTRSEHPIRASAATSGLSTVPSRGEQLDHQVRGRAEVLVEEVRGMCRLRGRVGVAARPELVGSPAAENDADAEQEHEGAASTALGRRTVKVASWLNMPPFAELLRITFTTSGSNATRNMREGCGKTLVLSKGAFLKAPNHPVTARTRESISSGSRTWSRSVPRAFAMSRETCICE